MLFINSFTVSFAQLNLREAGISISPVRLQLSVQHFVRRVQSLQVLNVELDLLMRSTAHFAFLLSRSMFLMNHKRARHHIHLRSTLSQMLEMRHSIESIVHKTLDEERGFHRQSHHIESILQFFHSLLRLDLFIRHTSHRFRLIRAQLRSRFLQNPLRITRVSLSYRRFSSRTTQRTLAPLNAILRCFDRERLQSVERVHGREEKKSVRVVDERLGKRLERFPEGF